MFLSYYSLMIAVKAISWRFALSFVFTCAALPVFFRWFWSNLVAPSWKVLGRAASSMVNSGVLSWNRAMSTDWAACQAQVHNPPLFRETTHILHMKISTSLSFAYCIFSALKKNSRSEIGIFKMFIHITSTQQQTHGSNNNNNKIPRIVLFWMEISDVPGMFLLPLVLPSTHGFFFLFSFLCSFCFALAVDCHLLIFIDNFISFVCQSGSDPGTSIPYLAQMFLWQLPGYSIPSISFLDLYTDLVSSYECFLW